MTRTEVTRTEVTRTDRHRDYGSRMHSNKMTLTGDSEWKGDSEASLVTLTAISVDPIHVAGR